MKKIHMRTILTLVLLLSCLSSIALAGGSDVVADDVVTNRTDSAQYNEQYTGYRVTASSWYTLNNPPVNPGCAFDGDTTTSWDTYGEYEGAWIEIAYDSSRVINGFTIVNGKPMRNGSDEYFYRNSRVKELRVFVNDQLAGSFQLKDDRSLQRFSFNKTMTGTKFRFQIVSVYNGTYRDNKAYGVCISDISLI